MLPTSNNCPCWPSEDVLSNPIDWVCTPLLLSNPKRLSLKPSEDATHNVLLSTTKASILADCPGSAKEVVEIGVHEVGPYWFTWTEVWVTDDDVTQIVQRWPPKYAVDEPDSEQCKSLAPELFE